MIGLETNTDRVHGLEGIRGILALVVYLHHFILIFYPSFYFGEHNFWNVLLNPDFAVTWFFVHSGFVLSYKTSSVEDGKIIRSQILDQMKRRYLRLLFPVLFSIMLTYLFMKMNIVFNKDFSQVVDSKWLGQYLTFAPDWNEARYQSFYGAFFDFQSSTTYNSSLWTISYEMISSYLLFGMMMLASLHKKGRLLFLPLAFIIGPWKGMMAFLLGASLNFLPLKKKLPLLYTLPLLIAGLILSDLQDIPYSNDLRYVGSTLVMVAILYMEKVRDFFHRPFFRRLGELSYSLYVMHFLVLVSVTSYLGLKFQNALSIMNIILIFFVSSLVLWFLSEICERFFDRPGQKLARQVSSKLKRPTSY